MSRPSTHAGIETALVEEEARLRRLDAERAGTTALCRYARELDDPPQMLPSGWASVLHLYGLR
jgi:hypothetical protein